MVRVDAAHLVERAFAIRADEPQRQIWVRVDQNSGIAVRDDRCSYARGRLDIRPAQVLADADVLSEPVFRSVLPTSLRPDTGLLIIPPPLRALGDHHRGSDEGPGKVPGCASDICLRVLDAHRGPESAIQKHLKGRGQ